ncbi:MAG: RNA polymerase sigma-54 factor [Acidobacteria bacterium]|nr:RNA polymerase sigma-54 factor [Acidobacteriota bacterium]
MSSFSGLRLNLKVSQKLTLTPGLVQMVSVLVMNKLELKEMINQEMLENPVLEEVLEELAINTETLGEREEYAPPAADQELTEAAGAKDAFDQIDFDSYFKDYLDPGYRTPQAESVELPSFENFLSTPTNLIDHLNWQLTLSCQPPGLADAIEEILGNLDDDGYLPIALEEIAATGEHELATLEAALKLVQECDPIGVAARDLRECLLLQLSDRRKEGSLAWRIVSDHLHQVENRQLKEIAKAQKTTIEEVQSALELIRKLNPFPGRRFNQSERRVIEPDVYVVKVGDEYAVVFNEEDIPQLRVSMEYKNLLAPSSENKDQNKEQDKAQNKEVRNYIKERYSSAMRFIKNIEQRKQTILKVTDVIVARQRDFLEAGPDYLKPMMIKDVAEEIGVHPSTVSRAVAEKYAYTPQGIFELRYFFSEAVNGPSGAGIPLLTLRRMVRKMIDQEDKANPLTDDELARRLSEQGIDVNRRTVAKYRADLKIPSTHQRRDRN